MEWEDKQWERILVDMELVKRLLPDAELINGYDPNRAYISVWRNHPSYNYAYNIGIYLYENYPFDMPRIYVHQPSPLYLWDGAMVPEGSHVYHTGLRTISGSTQICHCFEDEWDPATPIFRVVVQGIMWIEAHSRHLKTGKTIEQIYLDDFERRICQ